MEIWSISWKQLLLLYTEKRRVKNVITSWPINFFFRVEVIFFSPGAASDKSFLFNSLIYILIPCNKGFKQLEVYNASLNKHEKSEINATPQINTTFMYKKWSISSFGKMFYLECSDHLTG